jgi:hypothetical protein
MKEQRVLLGRHQQHHAAKRADAADTDLTRARAAFGGYRASMQEDHRELLDRFDLKDLTIKVPFHTPLIGVVDQGRVVLDGLLEHDFPKLSAIAGKVPTDRDRIAEHDGEMRSSSLHQLEGTLPDARACGY